MHPMIRQLHEMECGEYAWIITKDYLSPQPDPYNAVGVIGPRKATKDLIARLKAGEGVRFRMLDGDREPYYEGRIIGDIKMAGHAPLFDFGTPGAGATVIQYKNKTHKWEDHLY